jgi:bifunctional non-homologous end joining protein LigD
VHSIAGLPIGDVILDGEITALDRQGRPNFQALQRAEGDYVQTFWAFDLLRVGKCDMRMLPLEERKARLADLLSGIFSVHVRYSESFEDGQPLLKAAIGLGLEGVVSKRRSSLYRSGPCRDWVKVKSAAWRDANRERWKLLRRYGKTVTEITGET